MKSTSPTADTSGADDSRSVVPARARAGVVDRIMHAELARDLFGAEAASDDEAAAGVAATLGRFVVLDRIGAGGMGTVYRAYDPDLNRRIALKVLLPGTGAGPEQRERLRREAQALAQLTHPNVVTIHEVGTSGGELFLAMEFVEGVDLSTWARTRKGGAKASVAEALALLDKAGRGLAAAHAQGLVHRDFKPSNVLIGSDGRVKVADFGLARADAEDSDGRPSAEDLPTSGDGLTRTGMAVGTPRYMPPEQQRGREVDARSDQFSFCVSAWEVLFGGPPWSGFPDADTPPTPPSWAPRWLRSALLHGLRARPSERFATMDALLRAMHRGRSRSRLRAAGMGAGAVAVLVAGVAAYDGHRQREQRTACEEEGAQVEAIWNATRRDGVGKGLRSSGLAYAPTIVDKVTPWLDAHAAAWADARTEACLRHTVRKTWDAEQLDRSRWCLDERRFEFEALLTGLEGGDAMAVREAVRLAAGLTPVDDCVEEAALQARPAPPTDARADVEAATRLVVQSRALADRGAYEAAHVRAREAVDAAHRVAWPPLVATCQIRLGDVLQDMGKYEDAEQALHAGYFEAVRAHAPHQASHAAELLVFLVGSKLGRPDDGLLWARHADVWRAELPDPAGTRVAASLNNLANVYASKGEFATAMHLHERTLELFERALGPEHPKVAQAIYHLSAIASYRGEYARARVQLDRARELFEAAYGPEHPTIATFAGAKASILYSQGEFEQAEAEALDALARRERALGQSHPDLGDALTLLGAVAFEREHYEDADRHWSRALVITEAALGAKHLAVAGDLDNMAMLRMAQGKHADARRMYERSIEIVEAGLGPTHPDLGYPLTGLTELALDEGRIDDAVDAATRAVAIREAGSEAAGFLATSRFLLAKALWRQGTDRAAAVEQATLALDSRRADPTTTAETMAKLETWLAEHPL